MLTRKRLKALASDEASCAQDAGSLSSHAHVRLSERDLDESSI
jgi:hypothetical protein